MEDKRFAHIATDPKFKNIRKSDKKVKIDKRFQSMFKDKQFKVNYTVDKRGRTVNKSSNTDLRRYYHISSGESDSESESLDDSPSENEDLNLKEDGDKEVTKSVKQKLKDLSVDYARGESTLLSESSSDDEESDSEISDTDDKIEHKWGELDADAERTDDSTYRLAACNMDWDRIRAVDIMVLLNSFVPQGGLIKNVSIYPSEFGKERMKEEDLKGPIELVENQENDENKDENEEGSKYHMEKLRQYQLNRLKYYYAVIVCDSVNTASKIYSECDGMEYESSATKIDLRFIPDDMEFDDEPKEICEKLPDMVKYQPRFFTTTALQQAKVDLTWDETNPDRIEITQKLAKGKLDEIAQEDLQNYLASSSEDEEDNENDDSQSDDDDEKEENNDPIDKYRALLSEIENKEKEKDKNDVQMEITWGIDLEEKAEKMAKKKLEEKTEKTPFQKYLDKRKEKRKEKKQRNKIDSNEDNSSLESDDIPSDIDMNDPYFAEEFDKPEFKKKSQKKSKSNRNDEVNKQNKGDLELLLMDEDDTKKHFNFKNIQDNENESKSKKKRNKKKNEQVTKSDDFEINVEDERFSALYTSHHFNIDPSDPHYKKTKGMEKIISEKLKRRQEEDGDDDDRKKVKVEVKKKNAELNVLIKSVKRKTEALKNKKNK
ncbi:ESF1 homolog [Onthophagus taurus]|uniref:ESF1 homolog n=1 Tax=Onthophagus taurus TaxID=166361 RepID=UPI0039BE9A21